MRSRMEIREKFVAIARTIVRKNFRKREVVKMEFSKEELEKIKELDVFLKTVSNDNTEEWEKQFKSKEYLCVVVKMKIKIRNEDMETFIHQYIDIRDFYYEKCEYYIAKSIYAISKNKHAEVFFCVNGLKACMNEMGVYIPERKKKNMYYASSIFVDLDLPPQYAQMGNEELLEVFERENRELMEYLLPCSEVRKWYALVYSNKDRKFYGRRTRGQMERGGFQFSISLAQMGFRL